jgi:threonine/homoserine/homoserine lactone efflux protein
MSPVLEPGAARWHGRLAGGILLTMTALGHMWFGDIPTTWIPGLVVGSVLYLLWLCFRQTLQERKDERERRRQRRSHWGHE